jgi:hypothetical protein
VVSHAIFIIKDDHTLHVRLRLTGRASTTIHLRAASLLHNFRPAFCSSAEAHDKTRGNGGP